MQAGALIEGDLGPIDDKEAVPPFPACVGFNERFGLFLVVGAWKVNSLIMERKEGNDYAVSTLLNAADRDASPLCRILRRRGIAVVTGAKKKDRELEGYGQLGAIGVVGKNGVVLDEGHEAVECFRVNPELPTKPIRAVFPPVFKKVEL